MSADAWRICPKCTRVESKKAVAEREADEAYGKVSKDEWQRLQKYADSLRDEPEETLREDYEIFMDEDGKLYINYRCSCGICGFSHHYEYEKKVT